MLREVHRNDMGLIGLGRDILHYFDSTIFEPEGWHDYV